MRLRVLDDDRPGYAQLAFDSPLEQPRLALSVRSQQEGGFLGPDGAWRKVAHFFTAERIGGDAHSALYRVGPEIVNFLRELDLVEFAAQDKSFNVETTWENAVPQMVPRHGSHSFYREPGAIPPSAPTGGGMRPARQPEPPASPPPPPTPEPIADTAHEETAREEAVHEEPVSEDMHREEPEHEQVTEDVVDDHFGDFDDLPPPDDKGGSKSRAVWLAALLVVGLAALGFGLYQFGPCSWFGRCVVSDEELAAKTARACGVTRRQAGRFCDITQECFEPYHVRFPNGQSLSELTDMARTADHDCQDKVEKDLHQCIADLKAQGRSACDIEQTCIQPFEALYRTGPLRAKIEEAARQARLDCTRPNEEEEALRQARQCRTDKDKRCALPGCYAAYLNSYGANGVHKAQAQSEAVELDQSCLEEDAMWESARECAADPAQKCGQPRCYAEYLGKYNSSGVHKDEAKSEAAKIDSECANAQKKEEKPKPPLKDAVLSGRYLATTDAACGAKQDRFSVEVSGSKISWEHDFLGIKYDWEGTIDPSGDVTAKVANFPGYTAAGHFTEDGIRLIQMHYPQCASGPVTMQIKLKLQ